MGYYKLISNKEVFAVVDNPVWVKLNDRGRIVRCEAKEASGVLSSDESKIYHIIGAPVALPDCEDIEVADITQDEYLELSSILECGGCVTNDAVTWPEDIEADEPEAIDTLTLEKVREHTLHVLSNACKQAIFDGIDITWADGSVEHFDLTLEDQLNLISLSKSVDDGLEQVPYHASGSLFKFYSAEDFMRIVAAADAHKTYHTAYYNSLKNWVLGMQDTVDIVGVKYGVEVPAEYCSEVFAELNVTT